MKKEKEKHSTSVPRHIIPFIPLKKNIPKKKIENIKKERDVLVEKKQNIIPKLENAKVTNEKPVDYGFHNFKLLF